jgi:hypothetical protein
MISGLSKFSSLSRSAVSGKLPPLWSSSVLVGVLRAPSCQLATRITSDPLVFSHRLQPNEYMVDSYPVVLGTGLVDRLVEHSFRSTVRAGDLPQLPRHRALSLIQPSPTDRGGLLFFSFSHGPGYLEMVG